MSHNKLRRLTKATMHVSAFFVRNSKYRKCIIQRLCKALAQSVMVMAQQRQQWLTVWKLSPYDNVSVVKKRTSMDSGLLGYNTVLLGDWWPVFEEL